MPTISPVATSSTRPVPPLALKRSTAAATSLRTTSWTPRSMVRVSGRGIAEQAGLEAALEARETLVLDADIADDVRGQRALRIDPVQLGAKADPGQPEADHRALLGIGDVALEPDEAALGRQLGQQVGLVDAVQHARELAGRCRRVDDLHRIGEDRGLGIVGRQQRRRCDRRCRRGGGARPRARSRRRPPRRRSAKRDRPRARRAPTRATANSAADDAQAARGQADVRVDVGAHGVLRLSARMVRAGGHAA